MKNVVSFEAASALKDAGFPQPKPAFGQTWYDQYGNGLVCFSEKGYMIDETVELCRPGDMSRVVFAPTATDILRELHNHFTAKQGYSVEIRVSPTDDGFQVDVFEDLPFDAMKPIREINENLDEACAAAYVETNKTPQL